MDHPGFRSRGRRRSADGVAGVTGRIGGRGPGAPGEFDPRRIAVGGVMPAFVFVMTYVPKVPVGSVGYVHLGDAAIYAAAFLFGPVVGLFAAAVGTTLADLVAG